MRYDFDVPLDRRDSDSTKWRHFAPDVLPLWTADMDFRVADPVIQALHARVDHGIFGYCVEPPDLREVIVERMATRYGWQIEADDIVFQTGVLAGFQQVCRAVAAAHDGILVQPPVYPPIVGAAAHNGSVALEAPLLRSADGRYGIDVDAFEEAIAPRTRVFILCNPHNPVGRVWQTAELARVAEVCLRNDVLICSDEIHCDLVYPGSRHVPIATLDPEVARRTVTLMAPSKTFNVPGLRCSFAIVPDPALRARLMEPHMREFAEVNSLGLVAALAAYRDGQDWLDQVLRYLATNRDLVVDFVRREMPGVRTVAPDATYLAWLDCRESAAAENPYAFFRDRARVGLSDGPSFGTGGAGFARLNFACTRATLVEALTRMRDALKSA